MLGHQSREPFLAWFPANLVQSKLTVRGHPPDRLQPAPLPVGPPVRGFHQRALAGRLLPDFRQHADPPVACQGWVMSPPALCQSWFDSRGRERKADSSYPNNVFTARKTAQDTSETIE